MNNPEQQYEDVIKLKKKEERMKKLDFLKRVTYLKDKINAYVKSIDEYNPIKSQQKRMKEVDKLVHQALEIFK